ncbi:UDP-N-acetylmuramoyl-L-alanyl-D-glutamate--2,6-diaminopimelate ligase, partial [Candidatus Berkelbacteria bacterium]|nr:UDP-N-acetylmuramoyl-L-alanyl-D-glutamate--2,6-diaminopimelate ligase [Candidatus Berkelbacteria bacterium]
PGRFNLENALAAIAATTALGIDLTVIKKALEKTPTIAGRMEKIENNKGFTVLVDYAHSPDAFNKIYQTLLQIKKGRIIHVFGATGDRDKTKRPIMGAIAGRFADFIILTNEDPYSEDPTKIMEEVAKGVPRGATRQKPKKEGKNFWLILDRKEAIQKAISLAQKDDIVIITGKGAEEFMVVGDKKVPFSDREVARELLAKK